MYFHKTNNIKEMPSIYVNGEALKNVTEIKYLGLYVDQTLTFKKHIKKVTNTITYNISSLKHMRNSLTVEAAFTYFNAMIIPHFTYCLTSWSQAKETTLKPLRSVYNQALKALDKKTLSYHHCNILRKYKLLSFDNIILYNNLRTIFKIINNIAPPPLKSFVRLCSEQNTRATRSTTNKKCVIPKRSSAFAQCAFSFCSIRQWNALPDSLKLSGDLNSFTRNLKKYIIEHQTCQH